MNSRQLAKIHLLGVINLTPNSFSDGHKHLEDETLAHTLAHFKKYHVKTLDIGAESTAPMNQAVGAKEEWQRLERYFFGSEQLAKMLSFHLSLDSFRPETVRLFMSALKKTSYHGRVIWNDVSGVLDQECFDLLAEFSQLDYVYCHNEVSARSEIFNHAKTFGAGEILARIALDFKRARELLSAHSSQRQLIFDPCLGFSKLPEENIEILKNMGTIAQACGPHALMIGMSRKSFLRRALPELESRELINQGCDVLQSLYFGQLIKEEWSCGEIFLRLHDPFSFELSKRSQMFLK